MTRKEAVTVLNHMGFEIVSTGVPSHDYEETDGTVLLPRDRAFGVTVFGRRICLDAGRGDGEVSCHDLAALDESGVRVLVEERRRM